MRKFTFSKVAALAFAALATTGVYAQDETTDLSEFFITNPHFTMDDPVVGGICTYDYDCEKNGIDLANYSLLPVQGWTRNKTDSGAAGGVFEIGSKAWLGGNHYLVPDVMSDGSTEGKVLGIVTCWSATAQYTQNVTLPSGTYKLSMSYFNSPDSATMTGGETAITKNLIGFVTDAGVEYLGETTVFPVNEWTSETVSFTLEEETSGYFTMGYAAPNVGSGSMPHFFIDGISLVYEGTGINPSLLALQMAINSANKAIQKGFYNGLLPALEEAIMTAQDLIDAKSEDEAANAAAAAAINEQMEVINASIAAYDELEEWYHNTLQVAIETYNDGNFDDLVVKLQEMGDEIEIDVLDGYTWSDEKIAETIASFDSIVVAGVKEVLYSASENGTKFENDLNISILFDQLDFYGETSEWNYGDASNFKCNNGTAEVWNQSPFTVQRTLTGLPAGTYTVTTRAFYRTADNATNLSEWSEASEPTAWVFAGAGREALCNVAAIASTDENTFPVGATSVTADDGTVLAYIPNSQAAAENVFQNEAFAAQLEKSVSTVLVSEGDLTFGIKADAMAGNCWVVWYEFKITYNAVDASLLDGEIQLMQQEVYDLLGEEIRVTKAQTLLSASLEAADAALAGDGAAKAAALKQMTEAVSYANQAKTAITDAESQVETYAAMQANVISPDTTLDNLMTAIMSNTFADVEEIAELVSQLEAAWGAYVFGQDGVSDATEANPFDLTAIIYNPSFEGNANYWTIAGANPEENSGNIGQNQGYQSASYMCNETGVEISQFVEAWRPNGATLYDGDIYQTIQTALPEGYYRLEVDGFATNQDTIPAEGIYGVYLMATDNGVDTCYTSIGIDSIGGVPQHFSVIFHSNGVDPTTVGVHVEGTNASWTAVDNFTLLYLGKETPTGIEVLPSGNNAATIVEAEYYNLAGQRIAKPQQGVNIVRQRLSDGTVKTVKRVWR